jgi:hypothetical protein
MKEHKTQQGIAELCYTLRLKLAFLSLLIAEIFTMKHWKNNQEYDFVKSKIFPITFNKLTIIICLDF